MLDLRRAVPEQPDCEGGDQQSVYGLSEPLPSEGVRRCVCKSGGEYAPDEPRNLDVSGAARRRSNGVHKHCGVTVNVQENKIYVLHEKEMFLLVDGSLKVA
jgi:hypothetical protein